jgi:pimeloyl-ACP methyl ester carboxylesterase
MRHVLPLFFCLAAALAGCGSAPSAAPRTHAITSSDGVRLAYETRGTGSPALVFIHGWCCNREHWKNQVDVFDDDHRVIALDLGGHGESGANRSDWTLHSLARDVQAVVEAEGLDRVIFVGHSMGGPVALLAAAEMPERTAGVIGVDTLHNAESTFDPKLIESLVARMQADFPGFLDAFVRGAFAANPDPDEALIRWITDGAAETDPAVAIGLMRAFGDFDAREALAACPVPVRCINAAEPTPTAVETNRKYNAGFDAVLIEKTGHFIMLERPAEFNAALAGQIRALEQR